MNNIKLDMIVETDLSKDEFNSQFIQWIESNNWSCGGIMAEVDDDGNKIYYKCYFIEDCKYQYWNKKFHCNTCKIKEMNCIHCLKVIYE